jgi:hypothetical protein
MLCVPICHGELVDKLTILKIKKEKMQGNKLENVEKEYNLLLPFLYKIGIDEKHELFMKLYLVNKEFWEYHDWQREKWKEVKEKIDIELYKRTKEEHILNDKRASIKKEINILTHSSIIEEKQFISYMI